MSEPEASEESLEELRSRRGQLRQAMTGLEAAAAAPVPGREQEWTTEVAARLGEVRREFARHISVTEGPEGVHEQMVEMAPRLTGRVRRLVRDHETIQHQLDEAEAAVTEALALGEAGASMATDEGDLAPGDMYEAVAEVRRRITDVLGGLSRHRQRGSDLIWEAFSYDLGGET